MHFKSNDLEHKQRILNKQNLDIWLGPNDTGLRHVKHEGAAMKLADKRVLITGGSSGIGLATAQAMIAKGAHVFVTG